MCVFEREMLGETTPKMLANYILVFSSSFLILLFLLLIIIFQFFFFYFLSWAFIL